MGVQADDLSGEVTAERAGEAGARGGATAARLALPPWLSRLPRAARIPRLSLPPRPRSSARPAGAGDLRRWYRPRWVALAVVAALLVPVGWSYGRALTARGTDGLSLRSIEWLRDHHAGGLVSFVEHEWYRFHQPPVGGRPRSALIEGFAPGAARSGADRAVIRAAPHLQPPAPVVPFAAPALPGEGQWRPAGRPVGGTPAVYVTFLRPDAVHTSLVTGLAWMDTRLLSTALFAGYQEPGGAGWQDTAPIPVPIRDSVVAAFNSGFRLRDRAGGYYAEGRLVRPLVDGLASLVIDREGTATVAQWGRDARMGPDVAAVRQNLALIVDHGAPVPGVDTESFRMWGATLGNRVLVWRSGVGVTAGGALVYAGGQGLSVGSLARVLARAGAVRAMELDINTSWVSFYYFDPPPGQEASPVNGAKLVADMARPTSRYFQLSSRDFFVLLARYPDQLMPVPGR